MVSITLAIQPNDLNNAHLQQLIHARNLIHNRHDILHGLRHRAIRKENECVALACCVGLGREEGLDEFWCIRDEVLEFTIDVVHGENSVLADVGVTVFEAGTACGDEGFKELLISRDLLQESESGATNVFVWVLLRGNVN